MIKDRNLEVRVNAILDFWFGNLPADDFFPAEKSKLWFSGLAEVDAAVRENFAKDVERALRGKLASWEKEPRSCLALIILLDQFPRHLYRDSPQAFEADEKAADVCLWGIEQGYDRKLKPVERWFFYLPLMHAEDADLQKMSVDAYTHLTEEAPDALKEALSGALDYARQHQAVVQRFGRFPHRNAVLGRQNTPEETDFLKQNL